MKTRSIGRILAVLLLFVCLPAIKAYGAGEAYDPTPPDGAGSVSLEPVFSWEFDGDSCSVYGGISPDDLRLVISNSTTTSVQTPQTLPPDTVFYWKVDVNSGDQVIEGNVWSFRTESLADSAGCSISTKLTFAITIFLIPLIIILLPRRNI